MYRLHQLARCLHFLAEAHDRCLDGLCIRSGKEVVEGRIDVVAVENVRLELHELFSGCYFNNPAVIRFGNEWIVVIKTCAIARCHRRNLIPFLAKF